MSSGVAQSWRRIEAWLRANGLPAHLALPPGASESAIRGAEAEMGLRLPEDVLESYRLHDGSGSRGAQVAFADMYFVLPLAGENSVVGRRARLLELAKHETGSVGRPDGPIKSDWWNPRWVPIASDGNCNLLCIDLDPAAGGTVGQVIESLYTAETRVLARSWGEWLAGLADALEGGLHRLTGHEHAVWLEEASALSGESGAWAEPAAAPDRPRD